MAMGYAAGCSSERGKAMPGYCSFTPNADISNDNSRIEFTALLFYIFLKFVSLQSRIVICDACATYS